MEVNNQLGFLIDIDKCIGCQTCRVSCQIFNNTSPEVNWRTVTTHESGTFPNVNMYSLSLACNHCEDPACIKVCPENAIVKRKKDGIVHINQNKCNGCDRCIAGCPYGAIHKNNNDDKVNKCNLCMDKIDKNEDPSCVSKCVGGALQYGKVKDFEQMSEGKPLLKKVEGFEDPSLTKPNTRFLKT